MIGSLGSVGFRNLLFTLHLQDSRHLFLRSRSLCFDIPDESYLGCCRRFIIPVSSRITHSFLSGFSCKLFNRLFSHGFSPWIIHACGSYLCKSYERSNFAAFGVTADLWRFFPEKKWILCLRTSLQQLQPFWVDKHPRLGVFLDSKIGFKMVALRERNTRFKSQLQCFFLLKSWIVYERFVASVF